MIGAQSRRAARNFFFQAEDGIRDKLVTGVQTCAFSFQAEDGIRDKLVTGVQTCALPIYMTRVACAWRRSLRLRPSHLFPGGLRAAPESQNPARRDARSEERRVGKECRSRWSPYH